MRLVYIRDPSHEIEYSPAPLCDRLSYVPLGCGYEVLQELSGHTMGPAFAMLNPLSGLEGVALIACLAVVNSGKLLVRWRGR